MEVLVKEKASQREKQSEFKMKIIVVLNSERPYGYNRRSHYDFLKLLENNNSVIFFIDKKNNTIIIF
jgi:hypothetical protein